MPLRAGKQARRWAAALALAIAAGIHPVELAEAAGETRSLKLYFVHTGEKAVITFKRNGKFDPKGLEQMNRFLRDWRRNEPTHMDPRLFDLVWEVYNKVGATDYINVVSGYRSPTTNAMLRSRTKGVAEQSQHMRGKAMDFYIPGIPLKTLRETAMRYQRGGVGFYPTSRSPFVHLDVASVRAWPRMERQDLVRLFPDGKTLHIPADGQPLPGYEQAMAEYKARAGQPVEIADAEKPKKRNLLSFLFGKGDEDEDADAITAPDNTPPAAPVAKQQPQAILTAAAEPAPAPAQTTLANAPIPGARPATAPTLMSALTPPDASNAAATALQAVEQSPPSGFADLGNYRIPVPTLRTQAPEQELAAVPLPTQRPQIASIAPAETIPVPEQEVAMAHAPGAVTFRPSTSVMMGASEPLKAPAPLRSEPHRSQPHMVVAQATPVRNVAPVKAARVTTEAPAQQQPETHYVPVYNFDPARF